ncbi:hypothetical protein TNCV_3034061 [Trichonephila clavipes]|nr:hypothetical protein TNCV_3034061 [Trichonephila clavipes]
MNNNHCNWLKKQPSLSIVQKVKVKKSLCSSTSFCKSQTTKDRNKKTLTTGRNRDSFRPSRLRHARRSCGPVGQRIQ